MFYKPKDITESITTVYKITQNLGHRFLHSRQQQGKLCANMGSFLTVWSKING